MASEYLYEWSMPEDDELSGSGDEVLEHLSTTNTKPSTSTKVAIQTRSALETKTEQPKRKKKKHMFKSLGKFLWGMKRGKKKSSRNSKEIKSVSQVEDASPRKNLHKRPTSDIGYNISDSSKNIVKTKITQDKWTECENPVTREQYWYNTSTQKDCDILQSQPTQQIEDITKDELQIDTEQKIEKDQKENYSSKVFKVEKPLPKLNLFEWALPDDDDMAFSGDEMLDEHSVENDPKIETKIAKTPDEAQVNTENQKSISNNQITGNTESHSQIPQNLSKHKEFRRATAPAQYIEKQIAKTPDETQVNMENKKISFISNQTVGNTERDFRKSRSQIPLKLSIREELQRATEIADLKERCSFAETQLKRTKEELGRTKEELRTIKEELIKLKTSTSNRISEQEDRQRELQPRGYGQKLSRERFEKSTEKTFDENENLMRRLKKFEESTEKTFDNNENLMRRLKNPVRTFEESMENTHDKNLMRRLKVIERKCDGLFIKLKSPKNVSPKSKMPKRTLHIPEEFISAESSTINPVPPRKDKPSLETSMRLMMYTSPQREPKRWQARELWKDNGTTQSESSDPPSPNKLPEEDTKYEYQPEKDTKYEYKAEEDIKYKYQDSFKIQTALKRNKNNNDDSSSGESPMQTIYTNNLPSNFESSIPNIHNNNMSSSNELISTQRTYKVVVREDQIQKRLKELEEKVNSVMSERASRKSNIREDEKKEGGVTQYYSKVEKPPPNLNLYEWALPDDEDNIEQTQTSQLSSNNFL